MIVFAAATGLRPAELFALEHRDLDVGEGAVYVRRAYANGRVWHVKTRRSMRGVPLQGVALQALRLLPPNPKTPLVFPNARGGYIDLHNFRQRQWRPALVKAGIEPPRQPYDLRHTYATFALRAGLSAFALSRYMGTSLAMIDLHYGHLASDGHEHAVALLDALAREKLVDAGWTPPPAPAKAHGDTPRDSRHITQAHRRGRSVDAARMPRCSRPAERKR
ncbi:MAG: site-specific integrase [Gaiellales bacterium]